MAVQTTAGVTRVDPGYRDFLAGCPDGIWSVDFPRPVPSRLSADDQVDLILRGGRIVEANDAVAASLGVLSGQELIGLPLVDVFGADAERLRDTLTEFVAQGYRAAERTLTVTQIRGGAAVVVSLTGTVERGALVRIWGVQRRKDRQAGPEPFQHAQKLATIGQLASSVAHDFNNLLTAILGYGEIVREALPADGRTRADMEQVLNAGRRAEALTRQLLTFSRRQKRPAEVFDLNSAMAEFEPLLRRLITEHVEIVLACSEQAALVNADRGQLELAVMNLVVNARDAMPHGGRVVIGTAVTRGIDGRPQVEVSVTDNGIGMSRELQARIFEPFFTTKPNGTGLGLATTLDLVAQNAGRIAVASEPGLGTTFTIFLEGLPDRDERSDSSAVTCINQYRNRNNRER